MKADSIFENVAVLELTAWVDDRDHRLLHLRVRVGRNGSIVGGGRKLRQTENVTALEFDIISSEAEDHGVIDHSVHLESTLPRTLRVRSTVNMLELDIADILRYGGTKTITTGRVSQTDDGMTVLVTAYGADVILRGQRRSDFVNPVVVLGFPVRGNHSQQPRTIAVEDVWPSVVVPITP